MDTNKFSIVVCTYNRLEYLKKCITALRNIQFPTYEIIIVNDGSIDGTKQFLDTVEDEKITVIHNPSNQGLSASRNTGIAHANFDIIAFTDDDCEVDKQWLSELSKGFSRTNIGFVIGQTFYISKHYKGYFPERLVSNPNAHWPMGCNIAYRKKVFEACGGFDDFYFQYNNEDSEMAIRVVRNNFSYTRTPDAIVYHQAMDWTPASLLRSARNASVWPMLKKKYPKHYLFFGPPVTYTLIVHIKDYVYLLLAPIFIPLLLIRYIMHGKRNLKIFFIKWPIYLLLRRYYIYKEAIKHKVLMF
ncbi:MAG: hypothetical protein COU34_00715 [Candidatus Magasanikbacteria bacterium CG10_big_fil_rev_8_21_14_0_10_43_9]|nr:MAG: hypothetical protein COU34_00715 [Candidatus Magasanikbacteria bacterium CG10_big_fil_rev_8_21_14_0_10_43_9]PIY92701.1 MAG: hypothetical protein COY70_01875 [Candidatus Magasanikbacteria bacterium CG_4_10_14_0_8_um_filter_42_12]